MRKTMLLFALCLSFGLFSFVNSSAQTEILTGGNMELSTEWSSSQLNSQVSATVIWNYTDDTPANGEGGCLNVSATVNGTEIQQSQYAIYQAVTLSADYAYDFDGAFKDLSTNLNQFWCEVYIGTEPVNGNDYNGNNGTLLAQFNTWNGGCTGIGVDGTFKNEGCHEGPFVPEADGEYYFVVKIGNGDWGGNEQSFNILLDELTMMQYLSKPLTDFSADIQNGFVPLTVQFTDKSSFATEWTWDFGDGNFSNEQNPLHTYDATGTYTVTLTAGNTQGDSALTKTDFITVKEVPELPVDGAISGGNMESETPWTVTYLNTPETSAPTATWNYTDELPGAGKGGCLYVSSAADENQRQYAIYQEVTLSNDRVYTFNGAFKDLTDGLDESWVEVFIGTEPVAGEDYGSGQWKIASFSTWDACSHAGVDGTFEIDGCYGGSLVPDTSGTYYFVLKVGALANRSFDFLIDQLSFIESVSKPYPAFSADNTTGFAPFTVQFTDNSKMADSWAWDFGNGNTSTEQNPTNTFTEIGKYTVSLTVTNEQGDSTLTKVDYITVNEQPPLPNGEKLYGGNMENPDYWNITNLNAGTIPEATWNYTADAPMNGEGGNLHVQATVNNTTSHYCIWQKVDLLADSAYVFDGLFKDITGVDHFWCEVYIDTVGPVDGADYGEGMQMITYFNTWESCTGNMVDGSFSENACVVANPYQPAEDGTYYFVLKLGNTDWEGNDYSFEVILDELTLKETTPVVLPIAEFFADVTSGDAPLTVQFYNQSTDAVEYVWDFGDGNTSTEEEPSHTYTEGGTYSVQLIAKSETAADTIYKENLITVNGNGLDELAGSDINLYPNPANDQLTIETGNVNNAQFSVYTIVGELVYQKTMTANKETLSIANLSKGVYIIQVKAKGNVSSHKLIVE